MEILLVGDLLDDGPDDRGLNRLFNDPEDLDVAEQGSDLLELEGGYDHQSRLRLMLKKSLHRRDCVGAFQLQVSEDDVEGLAFRFPENLFSTVGERDVVSFLDTNFLEYPTGQLVVGDDENSHGILF